MAILTRKKYAIFVPLPSTSTGFLNILQKCSNSAETGKFHGSAQNSAFRRKQWSLTTIRCDLPEDVSDCDKRQWRVCCWQRVPRSQRTRKLVDVLTPTETECTTEELQLDALSTLLSIYTYTPSSLPRTLTGTV